MSLINSMKNDAVFKRYCISCFSPQRNITLRITASGMWINPDKTKSFNSFSEVPLNNKAVLTFKVSKQGLKNVIFGTKSDNA